MLALFERSKGMHIYRTDKIKSQEIPVR